MKMAGEVAEGRVHERNEPSSSFRRTKAEYPIVSALVNAPYLAVRKLTWGLFNLELGHKVFRSRGESATMEHVGRRLTIQASPYTPNISDRVIAHFLIEVSIFKRCGPMGGLFSLRS